ncbi:MAG TPA: hypothetical protein VJ805_07575 [Nitrospiraceae bacterium]|nr:hypothetical protein [Nitrospiraceae bacterium]
MRHHVMRLAIAVVFILTSGIPTRVASPARGATPDPAAFSDLRQIKKFVSVEVQTQGTAEKVGLNGGDLTDLTRSAFLNKIPGIPLEGSRGPSADGTERLNQLGFFTCEVWTVGEEYIVAYHVDCNAGSYITLNTPGSLWNRALLGYGPKDEVSEAVRKGLRTIIEQFAMSFAKVRAEGGGR